MATLTTSQVAALQSKNKQNFSKLKPSEATYFRQAGQVVLMGDGHDTVVVGIVEGTPGFKLGQIKLIRPAKGKDSGEVLISGAGGQAEFKNEFELIMKGATMKFTKWQSAQ
jgi:hypothetical protein